MSKQTVISARVDAQTTAQLDAIAQRADRSRAWLVTQAVQEFIDRDAELMAFLKPGLDDIAAGRIVTQEAMEAKFEDLRQELRKQRGKAAA
jgi:predicted transcriptional regulator